MDGSGDRVRFPGDREISWVRSLTIWTGNPSEESKRVVAHPGLASGFVREDVAGRKHGQATKGTR